MTPTSRGLRRDASYDLDGRLTELSTWNNGPYLQRLGYWEKGPEGIYA